VTAPFDKRGGERGQKKRRQLLSCTGDNERGEKLGRGKKGGKKRKRTIGSVRPSSQPHWIWGRGGGGEKDDLERGERDKKGRALLVLVVTGDDNHAEER